MPQHCAIQQERPVGLAVALVLVLSFEPLHRRIIHSCERQVMLAILVIIWLLQANEFCHVPVNTALSESNRPDDAVSLGSILYVEIDGSACPVQDRCSPFRMCRAHSKLQQKCEPSGSGSCARADRDFGDDR
jgi:hypothetical protein